MDRLPPELPWWIAAAVLLFWFVGAYNRLVRLRSAALQAYVTLDAALARQLEFVQARALAADDAVFGRGPIVQLHATALQLTTLLSATRQRPLDPERMAALATALHVMLAAWQRLFPDEVVSFDADGMLSRPVPLGGVVIDVSPAPGPGAIAWPEPSAAAEIARGQFNQAVRQYNAAAGQVPAVLVAWVMQLRRAAELT
jgi:LemA protein